MATYTKFAVRGTITVLVISLFAALLGYLVRFVLARNLGVEDFGLFNSVFAFLGLIGAFNSLGVDKALIKFIPEFQHENKKDFIKSSIIYVCVIMLVINIIIITGVYLFSSYLSVNFFHSPKADIVLKILAIAFFLDSFVMAFKFAFQGFKNMVYFSIIDVVRMLIILSVVLIGVKLNYGLLGPTIAYTITPLILILIFGWILVKKTFPDFFKSKFVFDRDLIKRVSKYSIFVTETNAAAMILYYTDVLALTYFSDLKNVGLYSVALPTAKVLMYFPRAIGGVLLPLTSELWVKGKTKILSIGMIFAVLYGININFFAGIGQPQITTKIVYTAAAFNFVANIILIRLIGLEGAAIATTLSYFIMMAIGFMYIKKFIQVEFPIKVWVKTFLIGAIFVSLIWILKKIIILNIWVKTGVILAIACSIYVFLLFLFRVINFNELKELYYRIR